jgi:hypothetical protein
MKSSPNGTRDNSLRRPKLQPSRTPNTRAFDISQFLDSIAANLYILIKIVILALILLAIFFIFLKIYTQQGIAILPFEISKNENLSGVAIADQITAELVRIRQIHNTKYKGEILLKNQTTWVAGLSTDLSPGKGNMIVPEKELIKFSMANTGSISTGYGSLDQEGS